MKIYGVTKMFYNKEEVFVNINNNLWKKKKIEEMIQAAIYSESWKNSQTPRYHVINQKKCWNNLRKKMFT